MSTVTPAQIRGARGMLDWSMLDLARAAGVSVSTIKRLELGEPQSPSDSIRQLVRDAFTAAGVTFAADRDGSEVRLRTL